jgi:glycosyltransferase involved in cell wall biosynthesis
MAAGRPVILAIDGVIREVVEAARCGSFVNPGRPAELADRIRELAQDKELARAMGLRGRKYLEENFNRAGIGKTLLKILEEMVAAR